MWDAPWPRLEPPKHFISLNLGTLQTQGILALSTQSQRSLAGESEIPFMSLNIPLQTFY